MKAPGFDKRFGKRILKKRKELGFTQARLAELLGVARSYIAMWENGLHIPSKVQLIAISTVLGCPIVELDPNYEFDFVEGRTFLKNGAKK